MANVSETQARDGVPTYLGRGDPAGMFAGYYPAWRDTLAGRRLPGAPSGEHFLAGEA
jgi:hypothetical protein